jgi:3-oxoacyl-[acyl-carrier protein] reductase
MRNVIVTGGSRGLGLGIVQQLQTSGYRVLAISRKPSPHLDALIHASNGTIHFSPCDLGEIHQLQPLIKSLRQQHGPIFGLVNNAGISHEGALAMMPVSQIDQLLRVNLLSPIVLSKYVVRQMMADGGGRIVNLSSITAFTGYTGLAAYSATKAALLGFTQSLAREVGSFNITVNCIAPGFVATDLTHGADGDFMARIARRSALKRLTEVSDIANAVEYFLSDKAKNITGTHLTVDAGSTA